jgi:DNA (cytosine-5)-methyltransferase 1
MVEQISYTNLKAHKGGSRLWVEGAKLVVANFIKGARYSRIETEDGFKLALDPEGKYKVSGRLKNGRDIPIIDMILADGFGDFKDGTRIRAVFQSGIITITVHHECIAKTRREARFVHNLKAGSLKEASACTGGGVSAAAVHQAITDSGFNSSLAWVVDCEIKYLQVAYANNFAITDETVCYESTLEELETATLSEVDILSFSLPCAGLSVAGKSKHGKAPEEHESATSVFGIRNIIKASNPALIYSENVTKAKGSPMYILLLQELKRMGYTIVESILNSENTGSFENRPRYWFMAYSAGLPADCFTSVFDFKLERKYQNLGQLTDQAIPDGMWSENQYLKDKQVRDAAAGKGFAARQLLDESATSIGVIGRHYNKRRSTEPFIVNAEGKERLLTLTEHAKAKECPVELVQGCNPTIGHEILGQGIDYLQGYQPVLRAFTKLRDYFSCTSHQLSLGLQ